jgi:hypothetical protein
MCGEISLVKPLGAVVQQMFICFVTSRHQTDTNVHRICQYYTALSRSGPVTIVQCHQIFYEKEINIVHG